VANHFISKNLAPWTSHYRKICRIGVSQDSLSYHGKAKQVKALQTPGRGEGGGKKGMTIMRGCCKTSVLQQPHEIDSWTITRDWDEGKTYARWNVLPDNTFQLDLNNADNTSKGYLYEER
jgi:hypothetical protein